MLNIMLQCFVLSCPFHNISHISDCFFQEQSGEYGLFFVPSFKSNILFHQNIADHYPILASWLVNDLDQTDAQCKFRNTKFIHDESPRQLFLVELQQQLSLREVEILSSRDPSIAFEIFNKSFIKVFDKFAPMQNETLIKSNNKPRWLTNSLKNLKTKRNKAHRK